MSAFDDSLCDHCGIPRYSCTHSPKFKGPAVNRPRRNEILTAAGPTIEASQITTCPGCGEKIHPGEEITRTEDGWAHAFEVVQPYRPSAPVTQQPRNDVDFGGF